MRTIIQWRSLLVLLACSPLFFTAVGECAVIHVKPEGNNANDGLTWDNAKQIVQAGLNTAVSGDEVWVATGTYIERIILKQGVGLYGGFAGTETTWDQRDWTANVTVLDGNKGGSVVTSSSGATATTRIDGFTIRNGTGIDNGWEIGLMIGGGIYCYGSDLTIANNIITGNSANFQGAGIYCYYSSPTITNNTIIGNTGGDRGGSGICCASSSPTIANNTIAGNGPGTAIYCDSSTTVANSIVAFNTNGIDGSSGTVLKHNCVYNPAGTNYHGLSPGATDIQVDPLFVDRVAGDYHLTFASPCINAGDNSVVQPGWVDMDGQARIQGLYVDIGADEVLPATISAILASGWNLISLPAQPANVDPAEVFVGVPITDRLYRYDTALLSYVSYWDLNPSEFGPVRLGEGYWLALDQPTIVSYQCYPVAASKSISLSLTGWHLLGTPQNGEVILADCSVANTSQGRTVSYAGAVSEGWIQEQMYGWFPAQTRYWEVGLEGQPMNDDNTLRHWCGYWFQSLTPDLTLVVPGL